MKISLTVTADAAMVMALNAGQITVEIDGVELPALIEAVNQHGCSLQVASQPGEIVITAPLFTATDTSDNTQSLGPEAALEILINWLRDNIDCESELFFDNDVNRTDSAILLPAVEMALSAVRDLHHLQLLHNAQHQ